MHRAPPVHVQILASLAARAALPLLAWSRLCSPGPAALVLQSNVRITDFGNANIDE